MRKMKTVKIDDREITVKELRVKDIRRIMEQAEAENFSMAAVGDLLPLAVDLDPAAVEDLAPSEIKILWEAFREVNGAFFDLAARVGVGKALAAEIEKSLTEAFAGLSSAATPAPPTTATPSS